MKNYLKLKLNNSLLFLKIFLFLTVTSSAQNNNYPQGNLIFPINPGQTNYLAANMGELRTNHFHGGIDVKTEHKIGLPIHASDVGYVERIKVSSFGYGNVIYIRHPNNLVTVYAHLDKFNSSIADYVLKKQYENQSFNIELHLNKNELPITRGEIIGLAGNSGSSQGPHLHYEIRDTNDLVLNPSKFGFKEIKDNISPVFEKIAINTFDINSRVNGEYGRFEFTAVKTSSDYTIPHKIKANGWLGLELKAFDKKNEVHNTFGINHIQVFIDGNEVFTHDLNSFTFDETRHINSHINYPLFASTGKRFERLYVADGNKLNTYLKNTNGKFLINDYKPHKIIIKIKDDFDNTSTLAFDIEGQVPTPLINIVSSTIPNQGLKSEIFENILKISTKCSGDPGAQLYFKGNLTKLNPTYSINGSVVYLYDLRKGLPDSTLVGCKKEIFNLVKMIPSGQNQELISGSISISIPKGAMADTVYLEYQSEFSNNKEVHSVHNRSVSLFDSIMVCISPKEIIQNKTNAFIYSQNGGKLSFEGGEWNDNKIAVKTRNLGKFIIVEDTIKPSIKLIRNYGNSIQFNIADNLSGIKSFKASLDGYWLLMNYDHKRSLLWSERLDKTVPLKGQFILEVTDNAGNINTFKINL